MKNKLASEIQSFHRDLLNAPFIIIFMGSCMVFQSSLAQPHVPPPRPAVAPLIGEHYPNDADHDGIDDELADRSRKAFAAQQAAVTPSEKSQAQARLAQMVNVELIFKEPITQRQI